MRRLFGWMAGLAGIAALARLLSARRSSVETPERTADPAEALRRKLDEAREPTPPAAATPGPAPVEADDDPEESIEERRARVHAKAQEAIDAMQEPDQPA